MNVTNLDVKVNDNTAPLISVAMPVYNGEKYLAKAIESILAQSFKNFELVIIDDGSKDNSSQVVRDYQKHDARIHLTVRENKGLPATLNEIIASARGKYIARMDQDDLSFPDRFEKQVAFMEAHPEIGLVSSNAEIVNADGTHLMYTSFPNSPALILWSMCFFDPILHPTVFMRRSLVLRAGGYRNLLPTGEKGFFPEDYDLWTRMLRIENVQFYNLPEPLVKLRKHESNITNVHIDSILFNSAKINQDHIHFLLGYEIPLEHSQVFWIKTRSAVSLSISVNLVNELVQLFFSKYPITRLEKKAIKKEAAWRLIKLLSGNLFRWSSVLVIWRAFLYDPFFLWNSFWNAWPQLKVKLQRQQVKTR